MLTAYKNFENPVTAVIQLLQQLKVNVTDGSVNEAILSHPDYPSLLCISDCLKQWKVENAAIRVEKNSIDETPLPFIAFMGREFKAVTQITDEEVWFLNDDNKVQKENKRSFLNAWNGVALLAEAQEGVGENDYAEKKRKENLQSLAIPALIGFGLLWVVIASFSFSGTNGLAYTALLLCKLAGIIISGLLLWYEIDKYNPTLQKICTGGGGKTNCNAILNSSKSKIFSWLSWSEVGFFYFGGSFLALGLYPSSTNIIAWLNVLALPYILFSIAYQKFIAKQWCPLCLAVQGLLLAEFIIGFTGAFLAAPREPFISFLQAVLLFLLPAAVWYFIKQHLLNEQENKTKKYELARLKNNTEIFTALLAAQKQVTHSAEGLGITLGNPNATNTIIKVCNPYCGPCAKAHPEIEKLIEQNNNLKVQIIFNATSEEDDYLAKPVRHLLAIAEKGDEAMKAKSLDDWYMAEKKDYEVFAKKYPMNGELQRHGAKIDAMHKWCKATDISFTPTFFINGHQLPEIYNISDLKYLLF